MRYTLNCKEAKAFCLAHIEGIDLAARPVQTVEIKAFRKDRTSAQNKYYWKVVIGTIESYTGYSSSELHETFKRQLLPTKIITIGNINKEVASSTADLTTLEFEAYLEQIKQFAATNIGLFIPDANQVGY